MTSTRLVLFDWIHIKQVIGPPTTSWINEYNVLFPRYEEEKVDVEIGVYEMNNQHKGETFKYEREEQLCLGVAKVECKEYGL